MSESLALRTLVSVSVFVPWRMVATVLYIGTQPLTASLGIGRSALDMAELRCSARETVTAWCSQMISYAHCWRSVTMSQYARWSRAQLWWPASPMRSKIVNGRRRRLPMWTPLGAKPVAALTELLYANST